MDLRKAALIAAVAGFFGLLLPSYRLIEAATHASTMVQRWTVPIDVLGLIFFANIVGFYFFLFRNGGTLSFSPRLRSIALVGAVIFTVSTIIMAVRIFVFSGAAPEASVLDVARNPWTIGRASDIAGILSNFAYAVLLVAIFRHAPDETDRPVSREFRFLCKAGVITFAIAVALGLFRIVVTPLTYPSLHAYAARLGTEPPSLLWLMLDPFRFTVNQACLLVAPYAVWKSIRTREVIQ